MATITLKGIPDDLYTDLKKEAKNNHRSINGEVLFALQLYLMQKKDRPSTEEILNRIRQFRAKVKGTLTADEVEKAINEGRP